MGKSKNNQGNQSANISLNIGVDKQDIKNTQELGDSLVKAGASAEEAEKQLKDLAGVTDQAAESFKKVGKSSKKAQDGLEETAKSTDKVKKKTSETAKEFKILGEELDKIFDNEYKVKINISQLENVMAKLGTLSKAMQHFDDVFSGIFKKNTSDIPDGLREQVKTFKDLLGQIKTIANTSLWTRSATSRGKNEDPLMAVRTNLYSLEDENGELHNAYEYLKKISDAIETISKTKISSDKLDDLVNSLKQLRDIVFEIRNGLNLGSFAGQDFINAEIEKVKTGITEFETANQKLIKEREQLQKSFTIGQRQNANDKMAERILNNDKKLKTEDIQKFEGIILRLLDLNISLEDTKVKTKRGIRSLLDVVRSMIKNFNEEMIKDNGLNSILRSAFDIDYFNTPNRTISVMKGVKKSYGSLVDYIQKITELKNLENDLKLAEARDKNRPIVNLDVESAKEFGEALGKAEEFAKAIGSRTGTASIDTEQWKELLDILRNIETVINTLKEVLPSIDFSQIQTAKDEEDAVFDLSEELKNKNKELENYFISISTLSDTILDKITAIKTELSNVDLQSFAPINIKEGTVEEIEAASQAIKKLSGQMIGKKDSELTPEYLNELSKAYASFVSIGGKDDIASFTKRKAAIKHVMETYEQYLDMQKPQIEMSGVVPHLSDNAHAVLQEELNKINDLTVPVDISIDEEVQGKIQNILNTAGQIKDVDGFIKDIQTIIDSQSDPILIKIKPELTNFVKELQDFLNTQKVELKVSPKATEQIVKGKTGNNVSVFNDIVKYYKKVASLKKGLPNQGQEEAEISRQLIKNYNERIRYRMNTSGDTLTKNQLRVIEDLKSDIKRIEAQNTDTRAKNAQDFSAKYGEAITQRTNTLQEEANQANHLIDKIDQYENDMTDLGKASEELTNTLNGFRERVKNAYSKFDITSTEEDFKSYQNKISAQEKADNAILKDLEKEEAARKQLTDQANRVKKRIDQYELSIIDADQATDEFEKAMDALRNRLEQAADKNAVRDVADDFNYYKKDFAQKNKGAKISEEEKEAIKSYTQLIRYEQQYQVLIGKRDAGLKLNDREQERLHTLEETRVKLLAIVQAIQTQSDRVKKLAEEYENAKTSAEAWANTVVKQKQEDNAAQEEAKAFKEKTKAVQEYTKALEKLEKQINSGNYTKADTSNAQNQLGQLPKKQNIDQYDVDTIKKYTENIKELSSSMKKLGNETTLRKFLLDIETIMRESDGMSKEMSDAFDALKAKIQEAIKLGDVLPEQVIEYKNELIDLKARLKETKQDVKSFWSMVKNNIKSSSAYLIATYLSFQDIIRYARYAVKAVTELDTALTQLRVVSGASETALNKVADAAYEMANSLGSSTVEITNSITEWRRLGYTIEESKKLAEEAAKLSTGGLMDVSNATTALISAMQAFGLGVKDVNKVVDQYIYLGKQLPVINYIG